MGNNVMGRSYPRAQNNNVMRRSHPRAQNKAKTKQGRFVTVRKFKHGLMLCAVDLQDAPSVQYMQTNRDNHLAFIFQRGKCFYSPKVVGDALVMGQIDKGVTPPANHWFEKCDVRSSEHYGLRSAVQPAQYLYLKEKKTQIVSIRPTSEDCVLIRDR